MLFVSVNAFKSRNLLPHSLLRHLDRLTGISANIVVSNSRITIASSFVLISCHLFIKFEYYMLPRDFKPLQSTDTHYCCKVYCLESFTENDSFNLDYKKKKNGILISRHHLLDAIKSNEFSIVGIEEHVYLYAPLVSSHHSLILREESITLYRLVPDIAS